MSGQFKNPLEALLHSKGPEFAAQFEAAYAESKRIEREQAKPTPSASQAPGQRGEG